MNWHVQSSVNEISSAEPSSKTLKLAPADDYVYDIFYYRPSNAIEFASASTVATVTGLPPDSDDDGFSSESEYEDEADEDSNGKQVASSKCVPKLTNRLQPRTFIRMIIPMRRNLATIARAAVVNGPFLFINILLTWSQICFMTLQMTTTISKSTKPKILFPWMTSLSSLFAFLFALCRLSNFLQFLWTLTHTSHDFEFQSTP